MGTGADAGAGSIRHLLEDCTRRRLIDALARGEESLQLIRDHLRDDLHHCGRAKDLLGLTLELWLLHADCDHSGETFKDVVLDDIRLVLLQRRRGSELFVEYLGQRPFEALDVGSTLRCRDDVDEGAHRRFVSIAPPQRYIDAHISLDLGRIHMALIVKDRDGLLIVTASSQPDHLTDRFIALDECAVFRDAALMEEGLARRTLRPVVIDRDGQPWHQVGGLTGPLIDLIEHIFGILEEDLLVGPPLDACSGDLR